MTAERIVENITLAVKSRCLAWASQQKAMKAKILEDLKMRLHPLLLKTRKR